MGQTPIGTIVGYGALVDPGHVDPPPGWLLCDGADVSRQTFSALFSALGTNHGGGDGQTTFNLPDYRGNFLRGVDDGAGRDKYAATRHAPNIGGASGDTAGAVEGGFTPLPTTAASGTAAQG